MSNQPRFVDKIINYWPLLMACVIIVGGWVNFGNADAKAEERLTAIELKQEKDNIAQQQIQIQLGQIQTDIQWIRKAIAK